MPVEGTKDIVKSFEGTYFIENSMIIFRYNGRVSAPDKITENEIIGDGEIYTKTESKSF